MPSCWIEVNLDAIKHNARAIQELIGPTTTMIAVIKANAYGHGAVEVARALVEEGVPQLAVTRLDEALPVRAAGITVPILLLAPALPDELDEVVAQSLTACASSFEDARLLSVAAGRQNKTARVQLKVDTGMGRLGVEPEHAAEIAGRIAELPNIEMEAAFTHFATAAGPVRETASVHAQFAKFQPLVHFISRAAGIPPTRFHCANSAAILRFPSMRLSCVRPGTILYGQYPSPAVAEEGTRCGLKLRADTFKAKARIIAVKAMQPGQTLGYGSEWRATRPSRIATIAVGYADGLTQEPHTRSDPPHIMLRQTALQAVKQVAQWTGLKPQDAARTAQFRDQRVPIIGRIAMQQCSLDVTDFSDVAIGEEVVVSMRRTSAGAHLPRVYIHD